MTTAEAVSQLQSIPLDKIQPSPYQTRKQFDEEKLKELAVTLDKHGLMNAIVVRKVDRPKSSGASSATEALNTDHLLLNTDHLLLNTDDSYYELIAGERRLRAAKLLGWPTIEAKVEQVGDQEAAEQVLVENLQREDLNPIEQAEGYKKLEDLGLTQAKIADRVGTSQSTIAKYLALLDLPAEIREIIPRGIISERHARALSRINEKSDQIKLANQADREGWSVKETERRVLDLIEKTHLDTGTRYPTKSPDREAAHYIATQGFNFTERGKHVEIRAAWDRTTDLEGFIANLKASLILWTSGHAFETEVAAAPGLPVKIQRVEDLVKQTPRPEPPQADLAGIDPELIRLAQQGPKALYAKLYGPDHKLTELVARDTWAEMGGTWEEGLKTLLKESEIP
jgi:ParB family chromosome partitioning protein